MSAVLTWPSELSPGNFDSQHEVQQFLAIVSGQILIVTCALRDPKELLDKLFEDEAVQQRLSLIAVSPNSYNRVTSEKLTRLSNWSDEIKQSYPPRIPRPRLDSLNLASGDSSEKEDGIEKEEARNHAK